MAMNSEHKMHDMGEIRNTNGEIAPTAGSSKKEKYYPTQYLSSKKLPDIENFDIGDMINLHSINKVIGKREKEDGEVEVEIETHQCGIMKGGKIDEDEYKDMSDEEKDKADEKEVMKEE